MPLKKINPDAMQELQSQPWTGNIREFRNVIERLIILCEQDISKEDVFMFARPAR